MKKTRKKKNSLRHGRLITAAPTINPHNAVPYRTVLYCTVHTITAAPTTLYPTVPYPTLPYRTLPYRTVPYRTVPYPTVQYRTIPYRTVPYPTVLYRTVPYRSHYYQSIIHKHLFKISTVSVPLMLACLLTWPPIWRVAANMLNDESRTADKGWSSSLGVRRSANNSSPYKVYCYVTG